MVTVRLEWGDINSGPLQEDGFRVYRSNAPFDANTLPAVLATLPPDTLSYDDASAVSGTYYYAVSAFKGAAQAIAFADPIVVGALDLSTITATQWRILVEESFIGSIWIGQVQMRETPGGPNVAVHGTTGLASSTRDVSAGFEADKAFNNSSSGDGWFTNMNIGIGADLQFTFDTPRNIKEVALRSPAAATSADPRFGLIQVNVGGVWVNMGVIENTSGFGVSETRVYSAFNQVVFDVFLGDING